MQRNGKMLIVPGAWCSTDILLVAPKHQAKAISFYFKALKKKKKEGGR